MKLILIFCSLLLLAGLAGCTTHVEVKFIDSEGSADRESSKPALTDVEPQRIPLTRPIVIVADTQIHESRGTASRYFSLAGDEFVAVTIRTGQQTIGAADILADVLRNERASPLVLHLGDAIDVSCETEWDLYSTVMSNARGSAGPKSWIFAPGNHDGYLVGNFFPLKGQLYNQGYWDEVCNTGRIYDKTRRYRMTKNGVIQSYRESLQRSGTLRSSSSNQVECSGSPISFCSVIRKSVEAPWTSFMVQAVRLPSAQSGGTAPIFAILLDSSDYASQPKPGLGTVLAGVNAGLSMRQLAAVEGIMEALPKDSRVFFTAHHPFWSWATMRWPAEAQSALSRILNHSKSLRFIITAHTHEGGWVEHSYGGKALLELNTGSLIDWPVYYRTLRFETDQQRRIHVVSPRHSRELSLAEDCKFLVIPSAGSKYDIDAQQSESDRESAAGGLVKGTKSFVNALRHFGKFWMAKHIELGAQLLVYADVVDYSMSGDSTLSYQVPGQKSVVLSGQQAVAKKLRSLALCEDKKRCPAREKETVLYALEKYYWSGSTPEIIRQKGHNYRRCAALWASRESAMKTEKDVKLVAEIAKRTEVVSQVLPP